MDPELLTWLFLGSGLLLMLLELMLPSGISFFLGVSAVLVAALRFIGLEMGPATSVFLWLAFSAALVLAMRPLLVKYFGGERSQKLADEDVEAMDHEVEVIEPVGALGSEGRIRFRGATWAARTLEGRLPAGTKARILYRDNLTWIVEPAAGYLAEPLEEDRRFGKGERERGGVGEQGRG